MKENQTKLAYLLHLGQLFLQELFIDLSKITSASCNICFLDMPFYIYICECVCVQALASQPLNLLFFF